jgi:hypothetical protein
MRPGSRAGEWRPPVRVGIEAKRLAFYAQPGNQTQDLILRNKGIQTTAMLNWIQSDKEARVYIVAKRDVTLTKLNLKLQHGWRSFAGVLGHDRWPEATSVTRWTGTT